MLWRVIRSALGPNLLKHAAVRRLVGRLARGVLVTPLMVCAVMENEHDPYDAQMVMVDRYCLLLTAHTARRQLIRKLVRTRIVIGIRV